MRKHLGHYQIVSELGRGGMGVVYKAHEPSLNRYVAIKVLADHIAHDEQLAARFIREARSAAALSHPNITQIYFIGQEEGLHYFVMEYVRGESLSDIIRREGRLPPAKAAAIAHQTASGLAAAHDIDIIHRDIKPGNIMIAKEGLIKIADFGIAYMPDTGQKLTATGQFMGTPGYLSPEVCMGETTDPRSDIFSLGMVLYEMLAGKTAFQADSPYALLREVIEAEAPDISRLNPEVDAGLKALLQKMIAKKPEERHRNCHELADELNAWLAGRDANLLGLAQFSAEGSAPDPADLPAAANPAHEAPTAPSAAGPGAAALAAGQAPTVPATPPPVPDVGAPPLSSIRLEQAKIPVQPPQPPGGDVSPAQPPPRAKPPAQAQRKRSLLLPLMAVAVILMVLLAVGGFFGWRAYQSWSKPDEVAEIDPDKRPEPPVDPLDKPQDGTGGTTTLFSDNDPAEEKKDEPDLEKAGENPSEQVAENKPEDKPDPYKGEGGGDGGGQVENPPGQGGGNRVVEKTPLDPLLVKDRSVEEAPGGGGPAITPPPEPEPEPPVVDAMTPQKAVTLAIAGDPLLADPLRNTLTEFLEQDGFTLAEDIDAGQRGVDVNALEGLVHGQADRAVVIEITFLGERQLQYAGRSSTAFSARVKARCYGLYPLRARGRGWSSQVEYTLLNAERKAQDLANEWIIELSERLEDK